MHDGLPPRVIDKGMMAEIDRIAEHERTAPDDAVDAVRVGPMEPHVAPSTSEAFGLMGNTSYPAPLSLRNTALAACPDCRETPATAMRRPWRNVATDFGILAIRDARHGAATGLMAMAFETLLTPFR
jgi:hypothetical protein